MLTVIFAGSHTNSALADPCLKNARLLATYWPRLPPLPVNNDNAACSDSKMEIPDQYFRSADVSVVPF
jgi:hypothetical protein